MLKGVFVLLCGMYVGKHYPQYVPLPKISKECTDKVLKFLEELQKKESGIKWKNMIVYKYLFISCAIIVYYIPSLSP